MSQRTLIVYASRAGATAEVAQQLGEVLRQHGIAADVRSVQEVQKILEARNVKGGTGLDEYDSLIAGSAIWAGKPLPEMLRFLKQHHDWLAGVPVAYFILCDTLRSYTPSNRQIALGYAAPLRKIEEPIELGMFAGRRDFSTTPLILRWILMRVFGLAQGDWRNWEQITAWGRRVARQIIDIRVTHPRSGAA